jgi:hypothetical protein
MLRNFVFGIFCCAAFSSSMFSLTSVQPCVSRFSGADAGHQAVQSAAAQKASATPQMQAKEEILTNDSTAQLLKAGLGEELIISKIQKTKHNFDLSTEGMIALSKAGASSRLIHFMLDPSKPPEAQKDTTTAATGQRQRRCRRGLTGPTSSIESAHRDPGLCEEGRSMDRGSVEDSELENRGCPQDDRLCRQCGWLWVIAWRSFVGGSCC